MSRHLLKSIIDDTPVVAIIRRPKVDPGDCAIHFFANGIRLVEITMDTKGAIEVIESLRSHVPPSALLGAGTVTDIVRAEAALKAGATFFVTPNINMEVIRFAMKNNLPIMPGAMTPTEIWTAAEAGAEYVKVFPASVVGPRYFRELRGPFPHIKLMASGGINAENAHDFIASGADAIGIGGALVPKSGDDFDHCAEMIVKLIDITRKARSER